MADTREIKVELLHSDESGSTVRFLEAWSLSSGKTATISDPFERNGEWFVTLTIESKTDE